MSFLKTIQIFIAANPGLTNKRDRCSSMLSVQCRMSSALYAAFTT
jgi:hypothetical protein